MGHFRDNFVIAFRLFLFGVLTSIGYLLYGTFLTNVSPVVLTLNTFAWLFILQSIRLEGDGIRFRSPFRALRAVVSSHVMAFALCQFAYWYLFWSAASILNAQSGANFTTLALALLSLNTLATPIAMHYGKRDQMSRRSVTPFIILALPLSLAIVSFELDMTWKDLSKGLNFLDGVDWNSVSLTISSPAFFVCLCLIAAVLAEAVGDLLLTRLEIMKTVSKRSFANGLDLAAFAGREADGFIRRTSLEELLRIVVVACTVKLETASAEHDTILRKVAELRSETLSQREHDEGEHRLGNTMARSEKMHEEAESRLDHALECQNELETATPKRQRELRRVLMRNYWQEVYAHVEKNLDEGSRLKDAREAAVDAMAIIGLFISFLLFVVDLARTGGSTTFPSFWILAVLCLLGLTGSSARPICILPLLKLDAEALIPPIYAVRPLIYAMLGWLILRALHVGPWLQANASVPVKINILPHGNFTYKAGAVLALVAAGSAWWMAYRRGRAAS